MAHSFHTKSGSGLVLPFVSVQFLEIRKEVQPLGEILSTTTTYILDLDGSMLSSFSSTRLIKSFWLDMVHTLKGQWDCIIGDSDNNVICFLLC